MDLCLNMIVRDEAHVIHETLSNILEHFPIKTWLIHDTGSKDDTPGLIEAFFTARGIAGRLVHRNWENFGANRQYALADAEKMAGYVLFFDADNRVSGKMPALPQGFDHLTLNTRSGSSSYPTKMIVRSGTYRWRCVVHEGLYAHHAPTRGMHVEGEYFIDSRRAGARSRDTTTYYRDATILLKELDNLPAKDEDLRSRYTFYAANSWRDAGCLHEAVVWYRKRIALGGWADEVYCSWLALGSALFAMEERDEAIAALLSGADLCPDRSECLYQLARFHREMGKHSLALIFAQAGLQVPTVDMGRLFVWREVQDFWLDFEVLMAQKTLGRLGPLDQRLEKMRRNGAPEQLFQMIAA